MVHVSETIQIFVFIRNSNAVGAVCEVDLMDLKSRAALENSARAGAKSVQKLVSLFEKEQLAFFYRIFNVV